MSLTPEQIEMLYSAMLAHESSKDFDSKNWFIAGVTMAEQHFAVYMKAFEEQLMRKLAGDREQS